MRKFYTMLKKWIMVMGAILHVAFFILAMGTFTSANAQLYSLDFDGTNDYVSFANPTGFPTGSSTYTLEAWVYPDAMGDKGIAGWGNYGTTSGANAFRLLPNGIRHYWWSNDLDATTGSLVGAWHHIAATCSATERKIYLDGVLVASQDINVSQHTVPAPTNFTIGKTYGGEIFDGKIDNVRIWTVARTQAEIQAGMSASYGSGTPGLAASYNFNEGSGTTLTDAVNPATNNGTLQNFSLSGTTSNWVSYSPNSAKRYVKQNGTGDGTSWASASGNLQDMINASTAGEEVWVAAGTYQPAAGQSFAMKNGVRIYGGFAASGSPGFAERNWIANVTTLQGNNNRVVNNWNTGVGSTSILDGFTITGGSNVAAGAAMINIGSSPQLTNLIVTGNAASEQGGAFYLSNCTSVFTNVVIKNNTLSGSNSTGGGIFCFEASPTLINTLIHNNSAGSTSGRGGGMFCNGANGSTLINCTIANNTAAQGSGIYFDNGASNIKNTIIWSNEVIKYSGTVAYSNSLIAGSGGSTTWNTALGTDNGGNIDTNPFFTNAAIGDYTLDVGSFAVNGGNNVSFINAATSKDLAGNNRLYGNIDMGAYEVQASIGTRYVKVGGTGSGSSWATASGNLQSMVNASVPGGQVYVAAVTYQPASGQSFNMKAGVDIFGGFPATGNPGFQNRNIVTNLTVLQGNGASVIKNDNNGVTNGDVLNGFTITGGSAADGGGISNIRAYPTIENCIIRNNSATNWGGGLYNESDGVFAVGAGTQVRSCLIYSNTASGGGGAFDYYGSNTTYTNCTIANNSATQNGGGIHNYLASHTFFSNTIVWGNTAQAGKQFYILSDGNSTITANKVIYSPANGGVVGTILGSNNTGSDPQFINPATGNYAVPQSSPAVDAGNTSFLSNAGGSADILGNIRVYGTSIDIGAYELLYPITRYVKQGGNGDGLSWATASGDFGGMLSQTYPGSEVWVAKGIYFTMADGTFTMRDGVKIYGGFPNTGNPTMADRNPTVHVSSLQGNQSRAITNDNNNLTNTALLDGFTITNGRTGSGGAILNINSSPQFANLVIENNEAFQDGGGVYLSGSTSTFTNVVIRNNKTGPGGLGGGVCSTDSSPVFSGSAVRNNVANKGAGIYASGSTITFNNGILESNTANNGGGIYGTGSTILSNDITVYNNIANVSGGGIYVSQSTLTMTKSSVNNNTTGEGGGVFSFDSSMSFTNSIVHNNHANAPSGRGGGLLVNGANGATLLNCTIADNSASAGQGIYFDSGNSQIKNSIIANPVYVNSGTPVYTNSLIYGSGGSTAWNTALGTNNGGNIDANPQFGNNYTLSVTSPARNSGSNALFPNANTSLDLAGNARVFNGTIDMGAYENQQYIPTNAAGILYVVKGAAGNGTAWGDAIGELALALKYTKLINDTTPGTIKEVWVAKGTYKPMYRADNLNSTNLTDRDNTFKMVEGVKIYGHFNGTESNVSQRVLGNADTETILSGDYLDNDTTDANGLPSGNIGENSYSVVVASGIVTGILDGFTVTSGNSAWYGGGIYANNSGATFINLTIRSNFSAYGGGGLNLENFSGTISRSHIHHNKSGGSGGGVQMLYSSGVFEHCTISNNYAEMDGGGLVAYEVAGTIRNLIIRDNYGQYGGGISNYGGTNMQNILVTGNTAYYGGGIVAWGPGPMANCTITGNTAEQGDAIYATWGGSLSLRNSIVAFNGPEPTYQIHNEGGYVTHRNNLVQGSGGSNAWNDNFGVDIEGNIDADPVFIDAPNGNYKLYTGSPAIDSGNTALYDNAQGATDLAGLPRLFGNAIDIGAYEKQYTQIINQEGILYVVKGSTGTGYSWADAFGELGDALKTAKLINNSDPGTIQQIWVAKGTYKPMYHAENINSANLTDRANTFLMVEGVSVYGHFEGNESVVEERDFSDISNETILSGDFNNNDTLDAGGLPSAGFDENAAHIVIASGIATGVLDGFTIQGGKSTLGNWPYPAINGYSVAGTSGGGVYATNTGFLFTNLIIHSNAGSDSAGFVFDNYSGTASKLKVHHNRAVYSGGAGMINYSSGILEDSTISDNYSDYDAGAFYLNYNSGTLRNLIIRNNHATGFGGGIMAYQGGNLVNILITGNSAAVGGGVSLHETTVLTNCTISDNIGEYGAAIACFNQNSFLRNSIVTNTGSQANSQIHSEWAQIIHENNLIQGSGGSAAWVGGYGADEGGNIDGDPMFTDPANGDYTLQAGSAAVDAGNTAFFANVATATDLLGMPRLDGESIDIGAYEKEDNSCTIITTWNGMAWTNGVPASYDYAAVIEGDYNSFENGNITACSLTVNEGDVIIAEGDNFTIKGTVTINGSATFTIEHNANLIQVDDVDNVGTISVIKESAPMYRLDYAQWASPVAGQKLKDFSPETLNNRFYTYNPLSDAFATVTDPVNTDFAEGRGYLIRVANNHPAFVTADIDPTPWEGIFTGVPNNGHVDVSVIPANGAVQGYNAVGNPYPSSINIKAFFEANQNNLAENTPIFFWRKKNEAGTSSYASLTLAGYNANSGNPFGDSSDGVFDDPDDSENWVINPGQGFIVRVVNNTVAFNNEMRVAVNNGQMFRNAMDAFDKSRLWLNITNSEGLFGQTTIAYTPNTTLELDYGWDGSALTDGSIALYSLAGESKLGIQARPAFDIADEVPMEYKVTSAGSYSIALDHFDGVFAEGQQIYLRDNVLGITHNLQSPYDFTTESGITSGRFDVVYAEALDTDIPTFNSNNIIVYKQGNAINISTGNNDMKAVSVYDIRGRLLYSAGNINAAQTSITTLQAQEQMLIVQVTTVEGVKASRKIVF